MRSRQSGGVLYAFGVRLHHHATRHGNKQTAWQMIQQRVADRAAPPAVEGRALVMADDDKIGTGLMGDSSDGFDRRFVRPQDACRFHPGLAQAREPCLENGS